MLGIADGSRIEGLLKRIVLATMAGSGIFYEVFRFMQRLAFRDSLQPQLTPIWSDGARTIEATAGIFRVAHDSLQYDARLLHLEHFASPLVNNPTDRTPDIEKTLAVGDHLVRVETQAAISASFIQGLLDLSL